VVKKDNAPGGKPASLPDDPRAREEEQFFEEVSEELKQDRYAALWKKYGRYFVAAAVSVVVGVAGYQYWQQERQKTAEAASERFVAALALAKDGKAKEAAEAFGAIGRADSRGYGALARLQRATLLFKAGDKSAAFGAYETLASDRSVDKLFRDVAVLQWAYAGLDDADPAAMLGRLKPLTEATSEWRYIALELTALYTDRSGKRAEAVQILTELEKSSEAPAGLRARARELIAILGKS
jgi:hypothetical protein